MNSYIYSLSRSTPAFSVPPDSYSRCPSSWPFSPYLLSSNNKQTPRISEARFKSLLNCSSILGSTASNFRSQQVPRSSSTMRRGVSSGGGQSSLNYLFGSGEAPKPAAANNASTDPNAGELAVKDAPLAKPAADIQPVEPSNIPAGVNRNRNNYHRADGQNTGNFITDRPSTKVQAAPGGGSSLGYLFGGGSN